MRVGNTTMLVNVYDDFKPQSDCVVQIYITVELLAIDKSTTDFSFSSSAASKFGPNMTLVERVRMQCDNV